MGVTTGRTPPTQQHQPHTQQLLGWSLPANLKRPVHRCEVHRGRQMSSQSAWHSFDVVGTIKYAFCIESGSLHGGLYILEWQSWSANEQKQIFNLVGSIELSFCSFVSLWWKSCGSILTFVYLVPVAVWLWSTQSNWTLAIGSNVAVLFCVLCFQRWAFFRTMFTCVDYIAKKHDDIVNNIVIVRFWEYDWNRPW